MNSSIKGSYGEKQTFKLEAQSEKEIKTQRRLGRIQCSAAGEEREWQIVEEANSCESPQERNAFLDAQEKIDGKERNFFGRALC